MAADTGSDAKREAAFALHRFGLGPREGSLPQSPPIPVALSSPIFRGRAPGA